MGLLNEDQLNDIMSNVHVCDEDWFEKLLRMWNDRQTTKQVEINLDGNLQSTKEHMNKLQTALYPQEPSDLIEIERAGTIIKKLRLAREKQLQRDLVCIADIIMNDCDYLEFIEILLYSGLDCREAMVTRELRDLCYRIGDCHLLFNENYDVDAIIDFIDNCTEYEKSVHFEKVNGIFYPTTKDEPNKYFMPSLIEAADWNGHVNYSKIYGDR